MSENNQNSTQQKPQPSKPQGNPHAQAAGTYAQNAQSHTQDPRELEARVLLKAAKALQELQDNWDAVTSETLDEVLRYNRQIWLMFVDNAIEDDDPDRAQELRNNIASLGVFIFNRTVEILAEPSPDKLDILIEVNRNIAAGLMEKKPDERAEEAQSQGKEETPTAPALTDTVG